MAEVKELLPTLYPITPRTRLVPMIGHPIGQVITPEPMNRYFQRNGIDAAIVPMDIAPAQAASFFAMVRAWANCTGVSVTMPYKQLAFDACDSLSQRAAQASAVNLIKRADDGSLSGDMTDGIAFVSALKAQSVTPLGSKFLLIGAGGAGAAVAHAMAAAGAASVHILDIDDQRQQALRAALGAHHPSTEIPSKPDLTTGFDIVFNATPLGMSPGDPLPLDMARLPARCFIADAVTKPLETAFIAAARARGHKTMTGEQMALAQLPIQLPLWGFDYRK